jgi:hypothetical protein
MSDQQRCGGTPGRPGKQKTGGVLFCRGCPDCKPTPTDAERHPMTDQQRCAHLDCPGYPYKASEMAHPCGHVKPEPSDADIERETRDGPRELCLREYIEELPPGHRAAKQYRGIIEAGEAMAERLPQITEDHWKETDMWRDALKGDDKVLAPIIEAGEEAVRLLREAVTFVDTGDRIATPVELAWRQEFLLRAKLFLARIDGIGRDALKGEG